MNSQSCKVYSQGHFGQHHISVLTMYIWVASQ